MSLRVADCGLRNSQILACNKYNWRGVMSIIMILYYVISAFIAGMLIWNFIREKEDKEKMLLYLIVLIPFILRIFRLR